MQEQDHNKTEVKRYKSFTYWSDSDCIYRVGDSECRTIQTIYGSPAESTIKFWCDGYEAGKRDGIEQGKIDKMFAIRRVLGL